MTEVSEVFDEKKAKEKRMQELRRIQIHLSGITLRRVMEIGIEWQEITMKLLKRGNRPEWEEKSVDLYKRKKELSEFEKKGAFNR